MGSALARAARVGACAGPGRSGHGPGTGTGPGPRPEYGHAQQGGRARGPRLPRGRRTGAALLIGSVVRGQSWRDYIQTLVLIQTRGCT